jgi:hypothetical protein
LVARLIAGRAVAKAAAAAAAKAAKAATKAEPKEVKGKGAKGKGAKKTKKKSKGAKATASKGHPKDLRAGAPPYPAPGNPVDYNGARVYMNKPETCFRTIRTAGVYNTEKRINITIHESVDLAWEAVLREVDAWRAAGN